MQWEHILWDIASIVAITDTIFISVRWEIRHHRKKDTRLVE